MIRHPAPFAALALAASITLARPVPALSATAPPQDPSMTPSTAAAPTVQDSSAQQTAAQDSVTAGAQLSALSEAEQARARRLWGELRCPICEGSAIRDSPTTMAREMRQEVVDQVAAGKTDSEILDYFSRGFGEWVLLAPDPHGFNLVVYLVPAIAAAGGALLLLLLVRRWTSASPAAGGEYTADQTDPDLAPWEEVRPGG